MRGQVLTQSHDTLAGVSINDHHNQVHGVADHTDRVDKFFLSAIEGVGTNLITSPPPGIISYFRAPLLEASDDQYTFMLRMPEEKSGSSVPTFNLHWRAQAIAGNWSYRVDAKLFGPGADETDVDVSVSGVLATNALSTKYESNITFPSLSVPAGTKVMFRVCRLGASDAANDTYTGIIYIYGLEFSFTSSQ